jgi:hypothetical protein
VLNDTQQRALRQIEDLTRLAAHQRLGVGQIAVAALTTLGPMLDLLIRGRRRLKSRALVPVLASLLAPRPPAQTALLGTARRLGQPIQRRRPRRVARVAVKPSLKLGQLAAKLDDQRLKLLIARPLLADSRSVHACKIPCKTTSSCSATPCLPPRSSADLDSYPPRSIALVVISRVSRISTIIRPSGT